VHCAGSICHFRHLLRHPPAPAGGPEFNVNSYNANGQNEPIASWGPLNSYGPAWTSYGQDGDAGGAYLQMYDEVSNPEFSHVAMVTVPIFVIFALFARQRSANRG